ncbi:putative sphingolipid long chain base-responsive protein [Daldinia vernicosa]|uniref:putative sphingolipid long chain base-responsive protein n=1 Tax=Daldinia vernicosa TaxID=114800 RepID=UPI0020075237|nr:putative sphingolipid long chain base-responsive protein [Daldinia vernicosa]KAI0854111.1 putative sphingolipid long chain base-responsive protein [Daldinia vernicosa]
MDFQFFSSNSKGVSELERMSQLSRKGSSRSLGSTNLNRSLSIRSNKGGPVSSPTPARRKGFSFASLRGSIQPELSRRLYQLIKSTNNLVSAHEAAGRERETIAKQLSEWGEQTGDDAVSDISDKVGVVLSELGAQEETYAHGLDEARGILKIIRNTEKSVQPSRDSKAKIADEIQRLKLKEPQSSRLVILEQELVRAEAENLVAEAQLTNITRNKLKEAYDAEFAAVVERAEKQIILAKHGRRLLDLLDDSPVTPGDARHSYQNGSAARQILNDAEDDLKSWERRNTDSYDSVARGYDMTGVGHAANDGSTTISISGRGGGQAPVTTGAGRASVDGGENRQLTTVPGDENRQLTKVAGDAPYVSPTPTDDGNSERRL